jgi:DNA-directed RNA polymerase subunit H (RpoH/RPB5)
VLLKRVNKTWKGTLILGCSLFLYLCYSSAAYAEQVDSLLPERSQAEIVEKWNAWMADANDAAEPFEVLPSTQSPYAAGKLSKAYLQKGLNAANFFRYLARLPSDLVLDDALNDQAQHGAVLVSTYGALNHTPPNPGDMPDDFYSIGYKSTSSSNLYYEYGLSGGNVLFHSVKAYMNDADPSNIAVVGHRRWILSPQLYKVGFGLAEHTLSNGYLGKFSSMQVFDRSRAETVDFNYTAFPSAGYFPMDVFDVNEPWSVQLNPSRFERPSSDEVKVTLTRKRTGQTWTFDYRDTDRSGKYFNVDTINYGYVYAIIFRPDGIGQFDPNDTFTVRITGLKLMDGTDATIEYDTNFFAIDPSALSYTLPLDSEQITVRNEAGNSDYVEVTGLKAGDTIKVYKDSTTAQTLGSKQVASGQTSVKIPVTLDPGAGTVYVSNKSSGKTESTRTEKSYSAEPPSAPAASRITATNNAGSPDTVTVTGVTGGDTVKVYNSANGGTLLGSSTVAAGSAETTVSIPQLGTAAGTVYVSIVRDGLETARTAKSYSAEPSSPPTGSNIVIHNNQGNKADTIEVRGLLPGDVVKVYRGSDAKAKLLATSKIVGKNQTSVTISIKQLGTTSGSVYVSIVRSKLESDRTKADYSAEPPTAPLAQAITVTNRLNAADTVNVTGLLAGDEIKVYDKATGGSELGSGIVPSGKTEATVSIEQLGTQSGTVYVSIVRGSLESSRTAKSYGSEPPTPPASGNITVQNNQGKTADTVLVSGLLPGDVVKVYRGSDAKAKLLATSKSVGKNQTSVTISIKQLGTTSGSVYVSIVRSKLESDRTKVDYSDEPPAAPLSNRITVTNNPNAADTVRVTGLKVGDEVKVYDKATGGSELGSGTVPSGKTEATVSIEQLGTKSGTVYVSIVRGGLESSRTAKSYKAEVR